MNKLNLLINNLIQQTIKPALTEKTTLQENTSATYSNNFTFAPKQSQECPTPIVYETKVEKMSNKEVIKYIQNLLEMPENIEEIFTSQNNKTVKAELLKIITENTVDIKILGEQLKQNSHEAITKLLQIISETVKSGVKDIKQLKEVLNILCIIQQNATTESNIIKDFLLLYIPLSVPVFDKELNMPSLNTEEKDCIRNSALSIMFETINFANLLICLNIENNNLYFTIYSTQDFPKERFSKIISNSASKININTSMEFNQISENKKDTKEQNFKIIANNFISSEMLMMMFIIIKTVFKIDTDFSKN